MIATIQMQDGTVEIPLPEPQINDGIKYFDLGRKKSNRLPNGWFARIIQVFPSGTIRLWESEAISGHGSGSSFPADATVSLS